MKKRVRINWQRQHRWSSLTSIFLMLAFCISGVILNHRHMWDNVDVSRSVLPPFYRYDKWDQGLLKGTMKTGNHVLIYGSGGIWLSDSVGSNVADYNKGLPSTSAGRQIIAMDINNKGEILAASPTSIYRLDKLTDKWKEIKTDLLESNIVDTSHRISDMIVKGDSLIVLTRSNMLISTDNGLTLTQQGLVAPAEGKHHPTLFRTMLDFHNGTLFGLTGKIILDILSIGFIILCVTGLSMYIYRILIRKKKDRDSAKNMASGYRKNFKWHNTIGASFFVLFMAVVVSGWMLRPPFLIAIVKARTSAIPGTSLASDNPWLDKLRVIRYDKNQGDWILSTSEGWYTMHDLSETPRKLDLAPPVSIMGVKVLEPTVNGQWLVGSFSGIFLWDRSTNAISDYITGEKADLNPGPPFGKLPVAGFSRDFSGNEVVATYDNGTNAIVQPNELSNLPMSVWQAALETHTGRIFFGNSATYFYVFISGGIIFWCMLSGWKIRKGKRKARTRQ